MIALGAQISRKSRPGKYEPSLDLHNRSTQEQPIIIVLDPSFYFINFKTLFSKIKTEKKIGAYGLLVRMIFINISFWNIDIKTIVERNIETSTFPFRATIVLA
jgi:hypothetical protein